MDIKLDWLYIGGEGVPRNFKPPEPTSDQSLEDQSREALEADVNALKRTQRYVALGIIAVGTALASALNPPSDTFDFLGNMSVPFAVQTLNYVTFRKGVHLMRYRANERRSIEGTA